MNRYKLFSDRLINMLVPTNQRGRGHILWLQSLVKPLKDLNDTFQGFVKEKTIEANVTSQVLHFTWYLNHKFSKYFVDPKDQIMISHFVDLGVPVFDDGEIGETPVVTYSTNEVWTGQPAEEQPPGFYWAFESLSAIGASFKVSVPEINIDQDKFNIMLNAEINKYRLAGKTYQIEHT